MWTSKLAIVPNPTCFSPFTLPLVAGQQLNPAALPYVHHFIHTLLPPANAELYTPMCSSYVAPIIVFANAVVSQLVTILRHSEGLYQYFTEAEWLPVMSAVASAIIREYMWLATIKADMRPTLAQISTMTATREDIKCLVATMLSYQNHVRHYHGAPPTIVINLSQNGKRASPNPYTTSSAFTEPPTVQFHAEHPHQPYCNMNPNHNVSDSGTSDYYASPNADNMDWESQWSQAMDSLTSTFSFHFELHTQGAKIATIAVERIPFTFQWSYLLHTSVATEMSIVTYNIVVCKLLLILLDYTETKSLPELLTHFPPSPLTHSDQVLAQTSQPDRDGANASSTTSCTSSHNNSCGAPMAQSGAWVGAFNKQECTATRPHTLAPLPSVLTTLNPFIFFDHRLFDKSAWGLFFPTFYEYNGAHATASAHFPVPRQKPQVHERPRCGQKSATGSTANAGVDTDAHNIAKWNAAWTTCEFFALGTEKMTIYHGDDASPKYPEPASLAEQIKRGQLLRQLCSNAMAGLQTLRNLLKKHPLELDAGVWTKRSPDKDSRVVSWIFATLHLSEPYVCLLENVLSMLSGLFALDLIKYQSLTNVAEKLNVRGQAPRASFAHWKVYYITLQRLSDGARRYTAANTGWLRHCVQWNATLIQSIANASDFAANAGENNITSLLSIRQLLDLRDFWGDLEEKGARFLNQALSPPQHPSPNTTTRADCGGTDASLYRNNNNNNNNNTSNSNWYNDTACGVMGKGITASKLLQSTVWITPCATIVDLLEAMATRKRGMLACFGTGGIVLANHYLSKWIRLLYTQFLCVQEAFVYQNEGLTMSNTLSVRALWYLRPESPAMKAIDALKTFLTTTETRIVSTLNEHQKQKQSSTTAAVGHADDTLTHLTEHSVLFSGVSMHQIRHAVAMLLFFKYQQAAYKNVNSLRVEQPNMAPFMTMNPDKVPNVIISPDTCKLSFGVVVRDHRARVPVIPSSNRLYPIITPLPAMYVSNTGIVSSPPRGGVTGGITSDQHRNNAHTWKGLAHHLNCADVVNWVCKRLYFLSQFLLGTLELTTTDRNAINASSPTLGTFTTIKVVTFLSESERTSMLHAVCQIYIQCEKFLLARDPRSVQVNSDYSVSPYATPRTNKKEMLDGSSHPLVHINGPTNTNNTDYRVCMKECLVNNIFPLLDAMADNRNNQNTNNISMIGAQQRRELTQ